MQQLLHICSEHYDNKDKDDDKDKKDKKDKDKKETADMGSHQVCVCVFLVCCVELCVSRWSVRLILLSAGCGGVGYRSHRDG